MKSCSILFVLSLSYASSILAYERATHEDLSIRGLNGSANTVTALTEIGLDPGSRLRGERRTLTGTALLSIGDWFRAGAHDEDDALSETFARYRNHFFDPTPGAPNNGGFTGLLPPLGLLSGMPAPDWSLETTPNPYQNHSYPDARTYLFDGLTQSSSAERERGLARVFYALGHVVHVVQDLAQPQHSRNDSHGLGSLYEQFTNDIILGREQRHTLPYTRMPVPSFSSVRDLWLDQARFSNRNFLSDGTNFRYSAGMWLQSEKYANPRPYGATEVVPINQLPGIEQGLIDWCGGNCLMRFIASKADDTELVIPRASTYSIFTNDLSTVTAGPHQVSLNRFNFLSAHQHLIPRAVSYTTSVLDYFFRGKIDLLPDSTNQGQYLVRNLSAEPMKGKFRLYYDDATNTRREVLDANGAPVVWDTEVILGSDASAGVLAPGATMAVSNFPPHDPAPKVAGEYVLVFSGDMGEEKADLNTGAIGAVVGKLVRPYNGALYFAALNGSNQVQYFKLDRSGVSALGLNEPNPLAPPSLSQGNPVAVKQSVISKTASGGLVHRTAALIARSNTVGTDRSLVADLVTGALQWKSGLRWTARSEDPAIGVFEFNMIIADQTGYQAYISYDRRFTQNGQPSQASGAFLLPNLNVVGAGFNYTHMRIGELFVNGQGTLLYPRGNSSGRSAVQITLGSVPSAALISLPQGSSTHTTLTPVDTYSDTGRTCTLGYIDGLSGPATVSSPIYERVSLAGSESTNESIHFEGITADPESPSLDSPVSYRLRTTQRTFHSGTTESCLVSALDFSGSASRIKMHAELRSQSQQTNRQDVETTVGNQTLLLTDNLIEPVLTTIKYTCGFGEGAPVFGPSALSPPLVDSVNYTYEGFCPAPEQSAMGYLVHASGDYGTLQNRATSKKRVSRALTHQMEDALYYEVIYDPDPKTVLKFRDTVIPTPFVAETSPLGEVFIATQDFSVIEHHPKYGMPVLKREMIPQGITRLVGVVWM